MNQLSLHKSNKSLFDNDQIQLFKNLYCKGLDDNEVELFLHVCKRTGLDPVLKQIYPVKRNTRQTDGSYKMTLTIQTGIDGYRLIAERTGRYSPGKEPTFCYGQNNNLVSATAYIKKMTPDGTWHEVPATAFFDEYCQREKSGEPTRFWKTMPHGQLAKCAEALAIRKAYPEQISWVYTREEMQQSEVLEEIPTKAEEGSIEEEKIQLVFPPHIDQQEAMAFLEECVKNSSTSTLDSAMKRAAKDMNSFLMAFEKWKQKQNKTVEEVIEKVYA